MESLIEEKCVEKVIGENTRNEYYILVRSTIVKEIETLHVVIEKEIIRVRERYDETNKMVENVDEKLNKVYANLIEIMSIFVSVFALITVNANIALEITSENISQMTFSIILLNVFVVICIIVLLLGTRWIIINPLKNNKNRKKICRK